MRVLLIISFFILLLSYSIKAQDQHVIDSCKFLIEEAKHDTSVCNAYLSWGEQVYRSNPDTALILWQKAHDLAKDNLVSASPSTLEKKYLLSLSSALNNIGYIHKKLGDFPNALEFYHKSLKIDEEIGNKIGIASALNNIGGIYYIQGDIPKVLEFYFKSLKIREDVGDDRGIANSLNNIGAVYGDMGDIAKALEFFHKSLKIDEEIGNKSGIALSLNNIGNIYVNQDDFPKALEFHHKSLKIKEEIGDKGGVANSLNNIGFIYDKKGENTKALEFYHKSLKINEEIGKKIGIASALNNIGGIYYFQGDIAKALEYYQKSLKIKEVIGDKSGIAYSLTNIASCEMKNGEVERAFEYGRRGLAIAQEIGSPYHISKNSGLLSEVAKKQGRFQRALEMYELHIQMRDSINNEKTQKASIRQQTKYEFEKAHLLKEQEEKEAARIVAEATSRRDNLQYSVILIVLLILGAGVLSLGRISVSTRIAEGIIFFSFLILFEFLLVLADPSIERWSGGAPGIKLLFNAGIAALIFPAHAFFESKMKRSLFKAKRKVVAKGRMGQ